MTYFLSPIGALRHFPRRRKQITVFASVAKQTPGRVEVYGVYSPYFFGGIFRCAQYDVLGLGDCRDTSCLAKTNKKVCHRER